MTDINIWEGIDFSGSQKRTIRQYLEEQIDNLHSATDGVLTIEIESVDSYLDEKPFRLVGLHKMYVVARKLGNYRLKILSVVEYKKNSIFPVDIYDHITQKKEKSIKEEDFLKKVNEVMQRDLVKGSIISLFNQSKGI